MKVREFIKGIQEYYGLEYRKGIQLNTIATFLSEKSEYMLSCLFSAVILEFSGQYKTLPDIAVFEGARKRMYEIYDERKKKEERKMLPEEGTFDYSKEIAEELSKLVKKLKLGEKV